MVPLRLRALLTTLALGTATAGCADNDSSLFVRSVLALESPGCEVVAQPDAKFLLFGTLDTALSESYFANLLVGNQLARQGDRDKVRTETAGVALRGAIVSVRRLDGTLLREYSTDGAGFVEPGTGTEPGYGIMSAELIPKGAVAPPDRVNVAVRVFGETLGGTEIESSELIFPINVCSGCLVSIPGEAFSLGCDMGEPEGDPPCILGQDQMVDCRHCFFEKPACNLPAP